jgi:hypothetical protein
MELNDELLCAYLDGELEPEIRGRVESALETDAGGRVRLERMRTADQRLRVDIPVPPAVNDDPLVQMILKGVGERDAVGRGGRVYWHTLGSLAAGLAGIVVGWLLAMYGSPPTYSVDNRARGTLHTVLESRPSGSRLDEGGESAIVLLTISAQGQVCRLYGTTRAGRASEGVACRERDGWRIVAWESVTTLSGDYRAAGASPLLDAVLDRVGGEPLAPADEQALLARGWRPAK